MQIQELQANRSSTEERIHSLTGALAQETRRREDAEQQAGAIGKRRSELESQLSQLHEEASKIQQLITRFASSLREVAEAASVRVTATAGKTASDVLPVKLTWSVAHAENKPTLRARVSAIAAGSANLQTAQMGTAEAGLAAAWQLAITLDGIPQIVTEASGPCHVEVTLPLALTPPAHQEIE
jgi:hypothetical protein